MTVWARKTVDTTDEQIVAMGMIVSDLFLSKMQNLFDPDYFVNDSLKTVCKWCMSYFDSYEQAPKIHIQDIFNERKADLEKSESQLIEDFLILLSKRYVDFQEPVNDEYFLNKAKEYFTKRDLKIRSERVKALLEMNKVDDAKDEMAEFKEITIASSPAIDPLDPIHIADALRHKDTAFFQYPGEFGKLVGPIDRGYLVGVLGLFKRGKTNLLLNTCTYAASCRLKVVFFSLEMQSTKVTERLVRNIGTFTKEADQLFPCFDCYRNQIGDCSNANRQSEVALRRNGKKPSIDDFDSVQGYLPCTYCRKENPKDYEVETWFERLKYPDMSLTPATKKADAFKMMYGDNLRTIAYPRFTANIKDIERDLQLLEEKELFIPDVVVIDYAGILKPEDSRENRIVQIDTTWKRLAQLASERNCVVFTATQGTRAAIKKKTTDSTDVAEWIGILGHVDIMMTLNQTPTEKESKILRVGILAHRHEDFNESENVMLLTNIGASQVFSDSQIIRVGSEE